MKGLELARAYYEVCAPLLQERIPDVMAQAAVPEKAEAIVRAREDGSYKEEESVLTDNAIRLYDFVYGQIVENRRISS